jgi:hypothetical protein
MMKFKSTKQLVNFLFEQKEHIKTTALIAEELFGSNIDEGMWDSVKDSARQVFSTAKNEIDKRSSAAPVATTLLNPSIDILKSAVAKDRQLQALAEKLNLNLENEGNLALTIANYVILFRNYARETNDRSKISSMVEHIFQKTSQGEVFEKLNATHPDLKIGDVVNKIYTYLLDSSMSPEQSLPSVQAATINTIAGNINVMLAPLKKIDQGDAKEISGKHDEELKTAWEKAKSRIPKQHTGDAFSISFLALLSFVFSPSGGADPIDIRKNITDAQKTELLDLIRNAGPDAVAFATQAEELAAIRKILIEIDFESVKKALTDRLSKKSLKEQYYIIERWQKMAGILKG